MNYYNYNSIIQVALLTIINHYDYVLINIASINHHRHIPCKLIIITSATIHHQYSCLSQSLYKPHL